MEEIIAKFEAVMDQYNADYTEAKDDKDRESIDKKYERIITDAESAMEVDIDILLVTEAKLLKEEHDRSEREIADEDDDNGNNENGNNGNGNNGNGNNGNSGNDITDDRLKAEVSMLKSEAFTAAQIASRYHLSSSEKNGFSTREIYAHVTGEDPKGKSEKALAEAIFNALKE